MSDLICPTDLQAAFRLAALRPRGDAWRNGGSDDIAGSVMGGFFTALGVSFGATERRLCDLVNEFFCSTANETLDLWRLEYGFPDACDPFADLCEKVNAVGDTTPAYSVAVAALRGWSIRIEQEFIVAAQDSCYGSACYGALIFGAQQGVKWSIIINTAASPSFSPLTRRPPLYGVMLYADSLSCPADIEPLRCLIRRIAPAHADLVFITE